MSIYNKEYAKKVYAGLLKRGYTSEELGDEVKFVERMGKESNRRILYDVVQQRNNANIGSWERFNGRMSSPSPVNESSYTFTEQELKEKFGPEENDDPVVPMSHVFQFGMAPVSMAQATSNAGGGRAEKPLTSLGNPYDEKRYSGFSRREIEWLANQPEEVRREQISDDVLMAQMEKIAREDIDTEELKYQLSELSVKTGAELERYAQERGAKQAQEEEKKPLWRRVLENMPKGGGVASTPDYVRDNASIIGDARWNTLKAADSLNKESQSIIEAAEKDKGFVGGMANKLSDIETWLPMLTAMKSSEILQLVDKFEKGEELTKDEENLLDALAVNVVVKLAYESDVSNAYSAGQSVAEMPGFMAEMVINPLSGASNMLVSRLGKYAVKKGIGAAILRAGAKAVGATAAGAGMAVTTGLPRTAADAMNRMAGQADYEIRDGKVEYAGQVNRESALEAGYKAVAEGAIQNASEMLGAEWVTKGVATVGKKVLGKSKAGREVLKALDAIENSSAGKAVKAFQNATKWNGTVEEFIEEIEAGVGSAVFVGDQEIKDVFDRDNLATTFLAVLAPGVTMGAVQTAGAVGGYYTERYRTSRDLNRARRVVEELMGEDAAEYINALDGADEKTMNAILAYVDESELPKEQKIAIMKYAAAKLKSDVSTSVLDVLATEEDAELEAAFTQGTETEPTPENKQVARTALLRAEEEMRSRLGWGSEADIELFLREHSAEELAMGDEQALQAINNYKREKAFVEGMRASIQDRREERYAEVDKSIDKNANKVDGNVYSTTYNGEEVFITGGNVVLNDNGTVDYDASSDALYISFPDGHTEQVAAKNFTAAVNTERAEDLKAAKHLEIDSELNAEMEANEQQGAPAENGNVTAENGAAVSVEQENNSVAPVVDKKAQRAELEALIPIEGKKKQFTKVEPAVTAEYIQLLTDDVAKQIATADKYIANIQAAQEKADPIEALEMDEQIAYWESVKSLLAPQESVSEVAEASPVVEETQAPVVESAPVEPVEIPPATNEMQPVSEEGVHPTIAAADEGRDTVGGSPVALAYLLEGGEGSILNAGYFLHGVAAAFPAVSSEIEALRGAMSGDVLGMNPTEFVAQRADEIAQIGELITNAYGDAGAAIYNELLNNASGFVPRVGAEVGARIEALQPLNESTLSQTSDQVGEQVAEGGNTTGNGGVVDNNNARDVLERAQAAQEADPEIAENEGENSTLEQIKAELGPLNRDNAAEYARRLFAVSPWKTLEEANVVLKELLASYGETLSGQTLGVVPFLDEARNLIIDNDIAELKEQNRVADERQQRIGLPPRVSDYSKAIAEGNAEAMKEWEGRFDDYLNKLLPADIPALDSTVRNMQGNKDAIKTGDPKGYKENPNYKAFDYIEKALKKRKKEIEESSINGEKSQEVDEKSTNNGENAPITTEDLVRMVREGAMRKRVAKWSKLLGVDIVLHESTESVTNKDALDAIKEADANGQYVKGWYDGKGHIYLPHNVNEADVDATVLHEIVAHLGIKEMLTPEQWDVFRDKVWEMMSEQARAEKLEYIGADSNNPTREEMRAAADEYVAELAENIKLGKELNAEEKNIWQKIVEFFKGIFAEKLNAGDILSQDSLTDADIVNMVLASFENLKKKGSDSQATGQGETMARRKKKTHQYQPASSEKSAGLNHSSSVDYDANSVTKVKINPETAKSELEKLAEAYKGRKKVRGFLGDLAKALGDNEPKESYYFEFKNKNGEAYTLRIANHNVNGDNASEDEQEISIVIKFRHSKNTFTPKEGLKEFVYFKEDIKKGDGNTLELIAKDVSGMLDTGVYVDSSGIAVVNPTEKESSQQRTMTRKTLLGTHSITEDKLRKAIKMGGLANPSAAVFELGEEIPGEYGEITFVMPSSMVDKKTGRNTGAFAGDAWTPTYPQVERQMGKRGSARAYEDVRSVPKEMQKEVRMGLDSWLDGREGAGLAYLFLQDEGLAPELSRVAQMYPDEIRNRVGEIAQGEPFYRLSPEQKQEIVDLYIEQYYNGDKAYYSNYLNEKLAMMQEKLADVNAKSFIKRSIQQYIDGVNEYGFEYEAVSDFLNKVQRDIDHSGGVNDRATTQEAARVIREKGLEREFQLWKEELLDRYEIKEVIFKGFTPTGNRRYVPHTLENVSKDMKEQGRNGAVGLNASFNKFAAGLLKPLGSLDAIRKRKGNLRATHADTEAFRDKWGEVYYDLAEKLQPDAKGYEDYGLDRVAEAATKKDPKAFIKSEYGIELSEADEKALKDMVWAIQNEYPVMYFETKFERPVYLDEFAGVVIPENTGSDVVESLENAGLKIETYEPGNEKARAEAIKRLTEEDDRIMFRRANKNQEVFVSNAQRAVEGIKQEKATPEQWIAMLKKNSGLKAGEDKWLGLEEWLNEKQGAVTKQEILDYIAENKIQIEEVEYAGGGEQMENYRGLLEKSKGKAFADRFLRAFDIEYDEFGIFDEQEAIDLYNEANGADMQLDKDGYWNDGDDMQTIIDWAESVLKDARGDVREIHRTRIQYTTEGLENKREIALTVPTVEPYNESDEVHFGDAGNGRAVAWVRFGETTDSEGNRVLVIDEIQSKRHQEGREKGYRSNADKFLKDNGIEVVETDTHIEFYKNGEIDKSFAKALFNTDIEKAKNLYVAGYEKTAVPSAPFEKNWHELAMKRMLRLAAEEGFDKVAWTTGEQQAERYALSRSVADVVSEDNNIEVFENGVAVAKDIRITTNTGSAIDIKTEEDGTIHGGEYDGKNIGDVVGKELAAKLMNPGYVFLSGDGLRIGGEGMKGFYDKMLPSFVSKYAKKWGAKVGTVEMPSLEQNNVMHSVDVTPEMKESVMEGQTMFRFIGKKGAENLDKAEEAATRLDNLNVAREMESAGKDAKTIKLATGWERGADGKWRYETEDAKVNREAQLFGLNDNKRYPVAGFIEKGRVDIDGTVRLDKLIDDEVLFDAYPELREYYVTFEEMEPGTVGSHNYDDKVIRFNRRESIDKLTSTLNHEIQHAVQHIEGFAKGGSTSSSNGLIQEVLKTLHVDSNYPPSLSEVIGAIENGYITRSQHEELVKIAQSYGYDDVVEYVRSLSPYSYYRRLAGEVESRNVQERMGMTPEERRNSLAEETADVAKEDQIFLFENQGTSAMMGSRVDARMAQVASELDARELSPEQRAVADVFGGKADNLTISVKTKEGNERKVVMRQGNEAHAGTKHSLYRHYNTGSGAITTDDILLIPEILANGERTENKRGNTKLAVYRLTDGNGTRYTVVTEVKEKGEVFNDFYTNKKASNQTPQMPIGDTQSSARTNDSNAPSADKGNSKSANEQATDEILSQQDGDEVAMTKGAINSLGEKLNTPMKILEDTAGLDERQKKAKGWYDTKTGEVVIVLPNNISLDDAIETVLHELVGHKGLRGVMGEAFDGFLDFVYENAAPEMKRAIDYRFLSSIREGRAMTLRECTEEYIASLAERGFDGYSGVWNAIKQWLRDFFRRFANVNVSDGELRYMLWKSYNRLQRGPIAEIEDIAMEDKTNTGDRANRFREVANDGISNRYDQRVEGIWNQFKEGWMDATRSMKVAQEEIQKEVGRVIVDTADFFNFTNTVPSRNRNKMDRFEVQLMNPFLKFLGRILTDKDISEKDLERYANAKHGIERNREMAVKEAMYDVVDGKRVFNTEAYEEYKKRKGAILTNGKSWIEQQNELDALATSFGATIKDYSGFTAIFAPDKEVKYTDLRKAAVAYVAKMEAELGEEDTKTLWKHIGDINGFSQNEALESGRISKEVFDANAQRYQYYVPLRGFTETTADEMYDYVSEQKSVLNSAQKRAQGRKSEANNIFATMLNIANSEIVFGNKNLAKQRLLNCALLYKTNLLSVGEAWYEKGDNNEYTPIYPNINDAMSNEQIAEEIAAFEERCKEREKQGEVTRKRQGVELKYKSPDKWNNNQHAVSVMRNGREYTVYVNGSPRLAQAMNGLLMEQDTNKFFNVTDAINRFRAKMVTGYSPKFVVTNGVRDIQESTVFFFAKYGVSVAKRFSGNVMKIMPEIHRMFRLYEKNELDMNNEMHRYFKEFLENGGETGYSAMISIQEYEKKINDNIKAKSVLDMSKGALESAQDLVEFANRGVENVCRFAAYMTSRENGLSVLQSVVDAKNVSVNFNRKGSGATGNLEARKLFMFLNPAVQSLVRRVELTRKYPKRMAMVWATELALGAALPVIWNVVYDLLGGDDDEALNNYYNLSDFTRRANLCIPLSNGVVKIPLSHEARVLYSLGEVITSAINGHSEYDNVTADVINSFAQILPLNPMEGWAPGDNIGEALAMNLSPDAMKFFTEILLNKDFAGNRIHNASDFNKHLPERLRGKRGTAKVYQMVSDILSGDYKRNFFDEQLGEFITPSSIEHIVKSYLGGMYSTANELIKTAQWIGGDEEYAEFKNVPIANAFYQSLEKYEAEPGERTRRDWEKAYQNFFEVVGRDYDTEKTVKGLIKNGDVEALSKLQEMENRGELLRIDIFNDGQKRLKELYEEKDAARNMKDYTLSDEIDKRIYAMKRDLVTRMETLADDPMSGYLMLTEREDSEYGVRETYGDARDVNIINEFQRSIKPIIDGAKQSENRTKYTNAYSKEFEIWRILKRCEDGISKRKKSMENNPDECDRYMMEIRKLRADAVKLINEYE